MKTNITYISAIGLHIFLGMIIYFNESLAKLYFFIAFGFFLYHIIMAKQELKTLQVLKACAYFVGADVFFRMTRGAISYESGKYLVMCFMFLGMFYKGISGGAYPYFLYLLLLIPSVFVASTTLSFDANFRTNIAFVLSGPVCLGVSALYCYDKKVSFRQCGEILLYMVLPIICHTVYIFFYNPTVRQVLTNNGSNRTTSGGWGPNQVSTILGLGMLIMTIRLFTKSPTIFLKVLNAFIFSAMAFRAFITFSRGGVITAFMCIIAFIVIYYFRVKTRKKNEIIIVLALFCFSIVGSWIYSSNETDGFLDNRYANKNHLGQEKSDVSTGRGVLFLNEIEGFLNNPFLGIGSSRAKDRRIEIEGQGITSHNEVSRTLAEHGIFGIIMLLILMIKPLALRSKNQRNYYFYAFMVFWFATINHSSMRIAAPAFIYALALLNVTYDKNPVHRKQISK